MFSHLDPFTDCLWWCRKGRRQVHHNLDSFIQPGLGQDDLIKVLLLPAHHCRHYLSHTFPFGGCFLRMLLDFLRLPNIVFFHICDHFVFEFIGRSKTPDPRHLVLQLLDLVHVVDHALSLLPPHLEERLVLLFPHLLNRLLVLPLQAQKSLLQLSFCVPSSWPRVGLLGH